MTLIETNDGWQVKTSEETFTGEFKTVIAYMNQKFGISFTEIEQAVNEMVKFDHNKAEFGDMNRTFMYSFK